MRQKKGLFEPSLVLHIAVFLLGELAAFGSSSVFFILTSSVVIGCLQHFALLFVFLGLLVGFFCIES